MSAWESLLREKKSLADCGIELVKGGRLTRGVVKVAKPIAGDRVRVEFHALVVTDTDETWKAVKDTRIVFRGDNAPPSEVGDNCLFFQSREVGFGTIYPPGHPYMADFPTGKRALQPA